MHIAVVGATGLVGSALVDVARDAGHEIVALSKSTGADVLRPAGLADLLHPAEVVVDVTQSPSFEETEASAFFFRAARNLGRAAKEAGVKRTVVLSIIGVDAVSSAMNLAGTGFDGYYSAKYLHELSTLAHAPSPHIVRSSLFHDLARQALGWGRRGNATAVPDLLTQPVDVAALVEVLLGVATGEIEREFIEVAGPRREYLADLAKAYATESGDDVVVSATPVGHLVREGILLPHRGALIVGPTFARWLATGSGSRVSDST